MVIAIRILGGLGLLGLAIWIYIARELRTYGIGAR